LELGIADGLSRKPYYILTNSNLSKDVPSDIKGLQRIEYNHLSRGISSLRQQLVEYFFKSNYHPTRILWNELKDSQDDPYQSYVFCLQVLAHLRDHATISLDKCAGIARVLHLGRDAWRDTCEEMWDEALLVEIQHGGGYRLYSKDIYKRAK
jgi:redox-regulated HSP33 family molecular chaperone